MFCQHDKENKGKRTSVCSTTVDGHAFDSWLPCGPNYMTFSENMLCYYSKIQHGLFLIIRYSLTVAFPYDSVIYSPVTTAWRVRRLRMEEWRPIWRVAANILNKQSRTEDEGCSSGLGVRRGAKNSSPYKLRLLRNTLQGLLGFRPDPLIWRKQRKSGTYLGQVAGSCKCDWWAFECRKMRGIYWSADLSASQEWLCFMDLVNLSLFDLLNNSVSKSPASAPPCISLPEPPDRKNTLLWSVTSRSLTPTFRSNLMLPSSGTYPEYKTQQFSLRWQHCSYSLLREFKHTLKKIRWNLSEQRKHHTHTHVGQLKCYRHAIRRNKGSDTVWSTDVGLHVRYSVLCCSLMAAVWRLAGLLQMISRLKVTSKQAE